MRILTRIDHYFYVFIFAKKKQKKKNDWILIHTQLDEHKMLNIII